MRTFSIELLLTALIFALPLSIPRLASASSKGELNSQSSQALATLVATVPAAKEAKSKAVAVLVFPSITKAGLMVGGQYGEGVLYQGGKPVGYYSTAGASYGLQIGAQKYGYAMFFMTDSALQSLNAADGFEVGVGPSVVVIDQGKGKSVTSKTLSAPIYAFIFSQKGLMAGLGLQGNKITKLEK
jgi:lipid-binding SYLF domain-containing protein